MPIEVYELNDTGQHIPVLGDASAPVPAADGTDSGVPGAPAETPATSPQDAGAPPAPPSSDSLGEEADEESEPSEAVSLEDFNRHMARMRARQRRAERARETERTQYQQELATVRGQLDTVTRLLQGQTPDVGAPTAPAGPPQSDQYADHDAYVSAQARYEAQQVLQQERQQTQQQAAHQQLLERVEAFKATHADFDAVIQAGFAGKVAPHVDQAVSMLPEGPGLAYALAQQPALLARLNQLPPPLVFLELGRLALPQTSPSPNAPTPPTGAAPTPPAPTPLPPPMQPVNGQGSGPTGTFTEGMSQDEYRAWRARTSSLDTWQKQRRS